jgi:hypothetical protein
MGLCYSKSNAGTKVFSHILLDVLQQRLLLLFLVYAGSPEVNPVFTGNR